jgi:hypothetical protein
MLDMVFTLYDIDLYMSVFFCPLGLIVAALPLIDLLRLGGKATGIISIY